MYRRNLRINPGKLVQVKLQTIGSLTKILAIGENLFPTEMKKLDGFESNCCIDYYLLVSVSSHQSVVV